MNKLRLYKVNIDYIKYLYKFDERIQYNIIQILMMNILKKRPYLGIVLKVHNFDYFVPLEHPREEHRKLKNNEFILKIHNGKYGILGFNNMLPIPESQLIEFNINEQSEKYKHILVSQYRFCNKHLNEIFIKAKKYVFK